MSEELEQFLLPRRLERMDTVLEKRTDHLTLVLDQVHHEHNVSAVLRSADAFGIQTVHLVGLGGKFSSGITQGADRWLDLIRHQNSTEAIEDLKKQGFEIVLVQPVEQSTEIESFPIASLPFERKLALVFGSEKQGISDQFKASADLATHVPMHGFVESFNISVAAAICMFCSTFSCAEPKRDLPPLSEARKRAVKSKWVEGDLRDAEATKRVLGKKEE